MTFIHFLMKKEKHEDNNWTTLPKSPHLAMKLFSLVVYVQTVLLPPITPSLTVFCDYLLWISVWVKLKTRIQSRTEERTLLPVSVILYASPWELTCTLSDLEA